MTTTPVASTSRRVGRNPCPCGVRGHLVEGGGGLFADGSLGMRRIGWLLLCSHLMVPLCIAVCFSTVSWVALGALGTFAHVSKSAN